MPTPARFRTACVARLWDETRYADARARARMLADAEAFVRDVDAAAEYPEELVIARVTRYRPEHATVGAVVPGPDVWSWTLSIPVESSPWLPLPASPGLLGELP